METNLTAKQSLEVINEMIEQARNNFQKGAGNTFILNGCATAFVALLNVLLAFLLPNPNQSFWVWWLMAAVWFIDRMINKKQERKALVKTHIDKIIGMTWQAFGIAVVLFLGIIFGYAAAGNHWQICVLITPVILIMAGIAMFVTAKACRFKPILKGAYIVWGGALCCLATYVFLHYWSGIAQFVILAACMLLGFAVPGYQLNKAAKSHV